MGGRTRMINGPMDCPPKLSKTISNNGSGFSNIQNPVTRMMAPKTLNQIVGVPSSNVSVSFMSLSQSRMLLFIARHQIHLVNTLGPIPRYLQIVSQYVSFPMTPFPPSQQSCQRTFQVDLPKKCDPLLEESVTCYVARLHEDVLHCLDEREHQVHPRKST